MSHSKCNITTTRRSHRTWKKTKHSMSMSACASDIDRLVSESFFWNGGVNSNKNDYRLLKTAAFRLIKNKKKRRKSWCSLLVTPRTPRGHRQSFSSTLWTLAQLMSSNYVLIISVGHHSVHSSSPNEDILKTFGSVIYLFIISLYAGIYMCMYILYVGIM